MPYNFACENLSTISATIYQKFLLVISENNGYDVRNSTGGRRECGRRVRKERQTERASELSEEFT